VSHRPLVLASGLTLGDYLLWNWSLNSNHDVLALVAGLTLPPLAIACLWLLAVNVARLIARYPRRPSGHVRHTGTGRTGTSRARSDQPAASEAATAPLEEAPATAAPAAQPSRRIAA
jgi:hypothetical protein